MLLDNLFNHVPEALVVVSPDYIILAATDLYLKTTMRKREELLGLHFLKEAFPEPGIAYENNPVKLALDEASSTLQTVTLPVMRYDIASTEPGKFDARFWETIHTPVVGEDGKLAYLIQTAKDVTERENARLSQQTSEYKFRFIADSLPNLVDTNDAEGHLNYFNKRWIEYTGLSEEQLIESGWEHVIHPADLDRSLSCWDKAFEDGNTCQLELRIKDKSGEYRWFLNRYLPMKDLSGHIVLWLCSCTDIHTTKLMVEELLESNTQMSALSDQVEKAYKKAESGRQTLIRLIEKAPVPFSILRGKDHRFDLVNQKYADVFPGRDLTNKTVAEAFPEIVEQGFIEILDNVYKTGEEFIAEEIPIQIVNAKSGIMENRFFTIIYQAMLDEDGKAEGILVTGMDLTETVKYRRLLEESTKNNN